MSELYETAPIPGFHVLSDCDTRAFVVAFFDGRWWLPGSEIAFEAKDVAAEGKNLDGRFHYVGKVIIGGSSYGPWEVENGRFR